MRSMSGFALWPAPGLPDDVFQSNHEGALIERVHAAKKQRIAWIIVILGDFTYELALRDAFASRSDPVHRVHCPTFTPGNRSDGTPIFPILQAGTVCGFGAGVTISRWSCIARGTGSEFRKARPRAPDPDACRIPSGNRKWSCLTQTPRHPTKRAQEALWTYAN